MSTSQIHPETLIADGGVFLHGSLAHNSVCAAAASFCELLLERSHARSRNMTMPVPAIPTRTQLERGAGKTRRRRAGASLRPRAWRLLISC